jgi:TonB family protein
MKISEKTAYNFFLRNHDEKGERELVLSSVARRRVFTSVIVGHLIFFVLPFVLSYIAKFFIPEKQHVISVKLIEDVKPNSITKPKEAQEEEDVPQAIPDPPKVEPKSEPEAPTPEPKPQPKTKKPEPKIETPVIKVPAEKPKPKKTEWKPRNPKEITMSKEIVRGEKTKPPVINSAKLKERLLKIQSQCKVTNTTSTSTTDSSPPLDYYDKVSSCIYRLWIQPSQMELKGLRPRVLLSISVDSNGKVLSSSMKSRSGNLAMDASVGELIKALSSLPSPPNGGMSFDVSLEISD